MDFAAFVQNLLFVLVAGLAAGVICKRLGISVLVGYLLIGAAIGPGGFALVNDPGHVLEQVAQAGALLLLFSIGLEFSLRELLGLGRYFFLGGGIQMLLVAVPTALVAAALGRGWPCAVLIGSAVALSSTILVFKALEEHGHSSTPHGRRAVGILLFQDVALVPLMLLVPLLAGGDQQPATEVWLKLTGNSALFVLTVLVARRLIDAWAVPLLAQLRSTELVVLFGLTVLGGVAMLAFELGLPPALGALAAGVMLGGNRLSGQIDALVLPYRETFAAIFFVSLGMLMRFNVLLEQPMVYLVALIAAVVLKAAAATVALRCVGLSWRVAAGMGVGLAQLGELSFMLMASGLAHDVVDRETYNLVLFMALGSLTLTPLLLKMGLRWADVRRDMYAEPPVAPVEQPTPIDRALVIGLGPVGSQVASQLEIGGIDVSLVDLSPVNLHPFAQQGFRTIAGDALDGSTLKRAGVAECRLVVITSPEDRTAKQLVRAIRKMNRACTILVRCHYQSSIAEIKQAGAQAVVSEEAEVSAALLRLIE